VLAVRRLDDDAAADAQFPDGTDDLDEQPLHRFDAAEHFHVVYGLYGRDQRFHAHGL
jgi:hypothetical protein